MKERPTNSRRVGSWAGGPPKYRSWRPLIIFLIATANSKGIPDCEIGSSPKNALVKALFASFGESSFPALVSSAWTIASLTAMIRRAVRGLPLP